MRGIFFYLLFFSSVSPIKHALQGHCHTHMVEHKALRQRGEDVN